MLIDIVASSMISKLKDYSRVHFIRPLFSSRKPSQDRASLSQHSLKKTHTGNYSLLLKSINKLHFIFYPVIDTIS